MGGRDHLGPQDMHAHHVRVLLDDIHLTHIDVALQTYQGGGGSQCYTVLSGAGFCDQLFLAHLLGQ